jgi:Flp pilus assembly protein TadG
MHTDNPGRSKTGRYASAQSPLAQRRRFCRGQTLVETAVTMVVFLTLIFGLIEFSYCLYAYNFVSYAAKLATRYAVVHGSQSSEPATSSELQSLVVGKATALDPTQLTVTASWSPNNNPSSTVTVNVTYNFTFVGNLLPNVPITLAASAQGVISQ